MFLVALMPHGLLLILSSQTLGEFMGPGWTLQDGSTLSLYDDTWFALKFQHADSQEVQTRFNLPKKMHEVLMDLVADTRKPDISLRELFSICYLRHPRIMSAQSCRPISGSSLPRPSGT